jgi:GTP-binding protein
VNFRDVKFIKSAADAQGLVSDGLPQVVFAGRSNVGKSSVLNCLLGNKGLARVSSSPGKTIHINYFLVGGAAYFVDLPGYGYAKVSKAERSRWAKLVESYFSDAGRIALGVMLVDARHKPTQDDVTMADWFLASGRPFAVVANKVEKVKKSEMEGNLALIRDTLGLGGDAQIIPFSAQKGTGKEALLSAIESRVQSG